MIPNPTSKGKTSEAILLAALVALGKSVLIPWGEERFDLVLYEGARFVRVQCKTGTSTISGIRSASDTSIVVRAPSRPTSEPLGMPKSAIGTTSAARTTLMRVGDPLVTSTNHGRATNVMAVPVLETTSAARSASRLRESFMPGRI